LGQEILFGKDWDLWSARRANYYKNVSKFFDWFERLEDAGK
jgi:hypothetical protein